MAKHKFYKNKYMIVFYDKTDTYPLFLFDNVYEILEFMKLEITKTNIRKIDLDLNKALKTDTHFIRFLTGDVMRVYIIEMSKEDLL